MDQETELVHVSWGQSEDSGENPTSLSLSIRAVNLPAFEKKLIELAGELGGEQIDK